MDTKSVRFESDFEQGGFTAVPNVVLTDAGLSAQARLTYALLRFYAWQDEACWPGQDRMASMIGCSDRSIRRHIEELALSGLVRVERRGFGRTNRYVLTRADRTPVSALDRTPVSALDRTPVSGLIEEDSVEENTVKNRGENVRVIFDHWREKLIHPNAKLDRSRRSKIEARLKDGYTVDDIKRAIDGCAASAWHMGLNPSNKKFDDIALICRDATKLEGFMAEVSGGVAAGDWGKLLEGGSNGSN